MSTPHVHLSSGPSQNIAGSFSAGEERQEDRHTAARPIRVLRRNQVIDGWLVDVSAHGARMVLPIQAECGDELVVQLADQGTPLAVPYVVRYWLKLWEGAYQIGVEVIDPAEYAEVLLKQVLGTGRPSGLFQRSSR